MNKFIKTILEIRYKPNPLFTDSKGYLIEKYSQLSKLQHWEYTDNSVNIFNEKGNERVFISINNCGMLMEDAPTEKYFIDKSTLFLKNFFEEVFTKDKIFLKRIGVKTEILYKYDGDFCKLKDLYLKNYVRINPKFVKEMEDFIYDIGCPVIFETDLGKCNINAGPMKKLEIANKYYERDIKDDYFKEKEIPNTGLFISTDYWNNPEQVLSSKEIIDIVKSFYLSNIKKTDILYKTVMGESNVWTS